MPGRVPGAGSQGREGTTGPGSVELEGRWQILPGPWGRVPTLSQCWVAAASPLLALGGLLACTPAPRVGTRVWQVPACHPWVSAASLLLPGSTRWFLGLECAGGSSVPGDVPRGTGEGSTGTELGWAPEHQCQGCLCHPRRDGECRARLWGGG